MLRTLMTLKFQKGWGQKPDYTGFRRELKENNLKLNIHTHFEKFGYKQEQRNGAEAEGRNGVKRGVLR